MIKRMRDSLMGGFVMVLLWLGYRALFKGQTFFDAGIGRFALLFLVLWLGAALFALFILSVDAAFNGRRRRGE